MKTGAFIKALRKDKGMTQKELAALLHITDRAVSKWERGLCAPDMSTLEPLAKILDITVTELIAGQRMSTCGNMKAIEESVQEVIAYSEKEITDKTKRFRKKYLTGMGVGITGVITLCMIFLWWGGYFSVVSRASSPDGEIRLTIYDRDIARQRFSSQPAVTVQSDGARVSTTVYRGRYQGVYWAPDSSKYVLSLYDTDGAAQLILNSIEGGNSSNLNAYLSIGVGMNELAEYGLPYKDQSPLPDVRYQFLQWSVDSQFILIYYSFADMEGKFHEGYFWYDCEDGSIGNTLEIGPEISEARPAA